MKQVRLISHAVVVFSGLLLGWMDTIPVAGAAARGAKPAIMDFTQGGKPEATHDWTLGATGAHGWMYGWGGGTIKARQILITAVDSGSPADKVLAKGDVILGVAGKPFDGDARVQFAHGLPAAALVGVSLNAATAVIVMGEGEIQLDRYRDTSGLVLTSLAGHLIAPSGFRQGRSRGAGVERCIGIVFTMT